MNIGEGRSSSGRGKKRGTNSLRWRGIGSSALLIALCVLAACGGSSKTAAPETGAKPSEAPLAAKAEEPKKPVALKVVLNWFAKHEHGGMYAAEKTGDYKNAGLDVTIEQGGPQVSSIQIVASGKAEFGIAHADQLILARKQGIPIVALATTFQTSPQMLMFHKDEPIKTFADVNGRQVFIQQGQPYWEFLKKQFKLDQAKEVAYTGQHVNFINDLHSVSQGFVSGEPFALKQQGVEVNTLLVADAGYKPYGAVIYTTEKYLKENPETVRAFIGSTVKGWYYYKDHVSEMNNYILEKNPKLSMEELNFGEQMQRDFIFGGDAVTKGVGYMTEERWSTLSDQLVQIGMLDQKPDVKSLFTTEYLPKK